MRTRGFAKILRSPLATRRSRGGAAMEYIIVSTFAILLSVAALGFIAKVFKEKIAVMAEKLGVDAGELDIDPFGQ